MLKCCVCGKLYNEIQAEKDDRTECDCGGGLTFDYGEEPKQNTKPESKKGTVVPMNRNKGVARARVSAEIQSMVDEYIEIDANMKKLQAQLKEMRKTIEPYMETKNLTVIKGSIRGSISLMERELAITTSRYSSYDLDGVVSLLDARSRRECITRVVDKEILELLVKTGRAPAEVNLHKVTRPSVAFTISHK